MAVCLTWVRNQHRDGAVRPKNRHSTRYRSGARVLDMKGLQTDEAAKLRREALTHVGNGLGDYYGDVLKEVIPDTLTDLLRHLAAPTEQDTE